jgi:hypothetical protein
MTSAPDHCFAVRRSPLIGKIFRAHGGIGMRPRLQTMKVPTLVVNSEYDSSLGGGDTTTSLIPGAVHRILRKKVTPALSRMLRPSTHFNCALAGWHGVC